MIGVKEVPLNGCGFQNIMDCFSGYLPFASVRQCKYVMDNAKIEEDKWRAKHDDLAEEHKRPGAGEARRAGIKAWLASDFYLQHSRKFFSFSKSTNFVPPRRLL